MALNSSFPFEVFQPEISDSFRDLAQEYSIPPDFLGSTALFTIAALSGNMYQTELNGSIKNIIYSMLVGQSGTGKTPAFDLLCGNIVAPLNKELWSQWESAMQDWREKKEYAKAAKPAVAFTEAQPIRRLRILTGGTMEGIMSHAMSSPAGFGIYYDEGGEMLGSPNQYKKETSSVDFWNKMWNGQSFNEVRADKERERFVAETSISTLIGMQTDRIARYFTSDIVDSGLPHRFLITLSEVMPLREDIDHFNTDKRKPCFQWRNLVTNLFNRGANNYFKDDKPYIIPFTTEAKAAYNQLSSDLIKSSNKLRMNQVKGDASGLMVNYETKLYAYAARFLIVLAIIDNYAEPVITAEHVSKSRLLYNYYRTQAQILFSGLVDDGLNENERLLLDSLPDDVAFGKEEILLACHGLNFSPKFFENAFRRRLSKGYIKRISRGIYMKDN